MTKPNKKAAKFSFQRFSSFLRDFYGTTKAKDNQS